MFLILEVHLHLVLNGAKCAVNGLRQNALLLKGSECVNLHGAFTKFAQDVHNSYSPLNDVLSRNGKVEPGICCRSDAVLWPSWTMTKSLIL